MMYRRIVDSPMSNLVRWYQHDLRDFPVCAASVGLFVGATEGHIGTRPGIVDEDRNTEELLVEGAVGSG